MFNMHIPVLVEIGGIVLLTLGVSTVLLGAAGEQGLAQNASHQDGMILRDSNYAFENYADNASANSEILTILEQRTEMSIPAPVRHPGQPLHEVVFALPLRDDGKIWSGKVSFTASKPIEVEILHMYSPQQIVDKSHGEPYHAVLPGNRSIAISHLRDIVDVPIEINGTGKSSGS